MGRLDREFRRSAPEVWEGFGQLHQAAARKGATREEAAEVLGVTLLMAGGPASVWAPRALAAFDEFSRD